MESVKCPGWTPRLKCFVLKKYSVCYMCKCQLEKETGKNKRGVKKSSLHLSSPPSTTTTVATAWHTFITPLLAKMSDTADREPAHFPSIWISPSPSFSLAFVPYVSICHLLSLVVLSPSPLSSLSHSLYLYPSLLSTPNSFPPILCLSL